METFPQGPKSNEPWSSSLDMNATIITVAADSNQRPTKKRKMDSSTDGLSQQLDFIPLEGTTPRKVVPLPPRPLTQELPHGLKSLLDQRAERLQGVDHVNNQINSQANSQVKMAIQQPQRRKAKIPVITPVVRLDRDGLSKSQRKKRARALRALEASVRSKEPVVLGTNAATVQSLNHSAKEATEMNAKQMSEVAHDTKATGINSTNHSENKMTKTNAKKTSKERVVLDTTASGMKSSNHSANVANARRQNMEEISYTKTPWMESSDYSDLRSVQAIFTQELCDFVRYMEPTDEEHQVRSYVFLLVEREVQKLWPTARLVMYGSYRTRVYLPTSDMDMVVLRDKPVIMTEMRKLKEHFQKIKIGMALEFVGGAKVPLIKFNELHSGISVDISFNHQDGVQSGAITTKLLEGTPGLRSLMIILKHYLSIHGQNTPFLGGIGSYTLMIMIVSFLQMHPQVQSKMIDPEENLGVLLIEFFELYGLCFNFQCVGIAIAGGGSYLPKVTSTKKSQRSSSNITGMLQTFDPNNAANNTGKASTEFPNIRKLFERTYNNIIGELARRHQALFTGYAQTMAENRAARQASLLGQFLFVSKKSTRQRYHVQQVFYGGTFQKMFSHPRPQRASGPPTPTELLKVVPPVLSPSKQGGDWIDYEVDQLRALCQSWQGDQLGMETMLEMGRQLIIAQSKRTIAAIEERQGIPMSDEERGKVFEETLATVEKKLGFLEEAVTHHQKQLEIEKALADLRRSEESTISPPPPQEQEVEFVHAMDTDDEESEHEDEDDFFSDLMHRAGQEYGDSDDSEGEGEGADTSRAIMIQSDSEETPSGAGHRNPQNVHVSEESILLPQLYSASPSQAHGNSSRDEQIEAILRRAQGLDD